ncbi:protein PLASTID TRANSCRIPTIONALLY ACTIVE 16, chloroplastic [Mercurialis annua]|uniref:protein PLASTID TRANSCRIPTIONALLY ACTIVE 16, chloroplastic n=1 Tax=Mercurialis annua TaxID=3986 RepID=UPI0021607234|nr:protein PLASTID TRANSCRIPTIONALLY ACTIVE 16, chloroplastic [Mercurialis annua]
MAPTLTSNSFLLTTTPHSRLRLRVLAKKSEPFSPFQLGKSKDEADGSPNSSPFSFNFGKVPDMKSLIPVIGKPDSGMSFRRKDAGTVFVAGATGLAGIRIAQTLLREGFSVRAGVPELGPAQELARLAAEYKIISKEESKRLNAVQSTFKDTESIAKAIGNASKVVVTIGPTENGPTSSVSTSDALQVVEAAQLAGVGHVAIIYDSNSSTASTYNVLDGLTSFFNNLFAQSQTLTVPEFLQKVIETDVRYTFIKTSLTEDFGPESSYNLVVSAEGSIGSDYKVAKSQIASVVANVFSNTEVAENKVVEIFTDPLASSKSVSELFSAIPEDGRRKAYAEKIAKEQAEEEAKTASQKAEEVANAEMKKLSDQEAKTPNLAAEAQEKAEASMENLLSRAKDISSGFSWDKLSSQFAVNGGVKPDSTPIATVRGQAKARSLPRQKAAVKPKLFPSLKPKQQPKAKVAKEAKESKAEVKKLFGGLFQQETIYIDE